MSRLAKKSIQIPEKTEVTVDDKGIKVKGPLGELFMKAGPSVSVEKNEEGLKVSSRTNDLQSSALLGTYASHLKNMIEGVTKGYSKKLVIEGIGFKSDVKPTEIVLSLGYSHPVKLDIPEGLKVVSEKNTLTISGIDKEKVGQFSALIKSKRKPEPYKGKGIRYEDEVIRRKQGKKTV
jgi:large subunit ribosomal protein L6